jgi:hypothetical protein
MHKPERKISRAAEAALDQLFYGALSAPLEDDLRHARKAFGAVVDDQFEKYWIVKFDIHAFRASGALFEDYVPAELMFRSPVDEFLSALDDCADVASDEAAVYVQKAVPLRCQKQLLARLELRLNEAVDQWAQRALLLMQMPKLEMRREKECRDGANNLVAINGPEARFAKIKRCKNGWLQERWEIIENYLIECVSANKPEPSLISIYSEHALQDRSDFYKWLKGAKNVRGMEEAIRKVCQRDKPHLQAASRA